MHYWKSGHFFLFVTIVILLGVSLSSAESVEPVSGASTTSSQSALMQDGLESTGVQAAEVVAAQGGNRHSMEMFGRGPAVFVENRGQFAEAVSYVFKGRDINVFFTDEGPVFEVFGGSPDGEASASATTFLARFTGANKVTPEGMEPAGAKANYYIGADRQAWQAGVGTFNKVCYRNIYDGIDLYCWGRRTGLKYEFHVSPGADWRQIEIAYEGLSGLRIDDSGALRAGTSLGDMVDEAPIAYQETPSGRTGVECSYRLTGETSYGFDVSGALDADATLVIDPDLAWSTYLGGTQDETAWAVATDASGNIYVAGSVWSVDFPASGAYDTTQNGSTDVFIAKFAQGGSLLWATYMGGSGGEDARAIAIYGTSVYITGEVGSTDLPVTGVFDDSPNGSFDGFAAKFSSAGALAWSTYLGGSGSDGGQAIATDSTGAAYVTGSTRSSNFPVSDGYDGAFNGGYVDAFVTKFSSAGDMVWSSFYGGTGEDSGIALTVDSSDNLYLAGNTRSADFPVVAGYDMTYADNDAFLMKLTTAGIPVWSTFLGTDASSEYIYAVATDSVGNVYAAGTTSSSAFPAFGAYDSTHNGEFDSTLTKFSSAGALVWSTFLGGSSDELPKAVAVDDADNVYMVGDTNSSDFPVFQAYDSTFNRADVDNDAYAAKFSSAGSLLWSTYLGGDSYETAYSVATSGSGVAYVAGYTYSYNFPAGGGYDDSLNGNRDVFLAKFTESAPAESVETFLVLDQLQVRLNTRMADADRLMVKAFLNLTDVPVDWTAVDVTLAVGSYEETIPAGSFVTRNGITYLYGAPRGTRSGITRGLFNAKTNTIMLSAMGLDLSALGANPTVTLTAGAFEHSFVGSLNSRSMFKYGRMGGILTDTFMVAKAMFIVNTRMANRDSLSVMGFIYPVDPLDLSSEDLTLTIAGKSWPVSAGSFIKSPRGRRYLYRGPRGSQVKGISVDLDKGVFMIKCSYLDLSGLGATTEVSLVAETFSGTSTISLTPVGTKLVY